MNGILINYRNRWEPQKIDIMLIGPRKISKSTIRQVHERKLNFKWYNTNYQEQNELTVGSYTTNVKIICNWMTSVKPVTVPRSKLLRLGYSYRQALNAYLFRLS